MSPAFWFGMSSGASCPNPNRCAQSPHMSRFIRMPSGCCSLTNVSFIRRKKNVLQETRMASRTAMLPWLPPWHLKKRPSMYPPPQ